MILSLTGKAKLPASAELQRLVIWHGEIIGDIIETRSSTTLQKSLNGYRKLHTLGQVSEVSKIELVYPERPIA